MKTKILTVITFIITSLSFAQGGGFNYKALITDNGNVLASHSVTFKFTVLENGSTSVYQETQSATTDANGIAAVNVGEGTLVSGNFTTIDWGNSPYFLKVEIDTGSGYQDFGTAEFKAVPYAKYADRVEIADNIQGIPVSSTTPANGQVLKYNGSQFVPADDDTSGGSGTDGVVNSAAFSGSSTKTLTLGRSNGLGNVTATFSDAVNDADHSATNELQTISKTGNTVTLSNGGGSFTDAVNDADHSITNELQTISRSGSTITLSNGGGSVTLPDQHDADFYKAGTTTPPTSNYDYIYHMGKISIGTDTIYTHSNIYNRTYTNSSTLQISIFNSIQNSGSGAHYGTFNELLGSGGGEQYGVKNHIVNSGDGVHFGNYSDLNDSGSGTHYGTYNFLHGTGTGMQIGVKNEITNSGNTNHFGIVSYLSGNGSGIHIGNYSYLNGYGTGDKYGTYNKIEKTAGGTHYAVYGEALKTGSYAGYFMGNVAIGKTGANKYILPATKGNADEIMQIDANGQVNWVAPSSIADADFYKVGTTTPPTSIDDDIYTQGSLEIKSNSGSLLVLSSATNNSSIRPGIQFKNNTSQYIAGDDGSNEIFGFYSKWASHRTHDARLRVYGKATGSGSWGKYIEITHDGTDATIKTDTGNISLEPHGGEVQVSGKITAPATGNADMKAYIYGEVTGGGTVITSASSGGFGVSHSTGVYTIIFSSPLSANNTYTVIASARESSQPIITTISDKTASSFKIYCWHGTSPQNNSFEFVVYKK